MRLIGIFSLSTILLAGCATQRAPSGGGDITLAPSAGASAPTVASQPARMQSVRGQSPDSRGATGVSSTTGAGVSTNIVFSSEDGPPPGGEMIASASDASSGSATGSGESVFSSLMSFFKSDTTDSKPAAESTAQPAVPADAGRSASELPARLPSQTGQPAASSAQSASRVGLAPGSAGPTPIGQAPAATRVQGTSAVPLVNNTIPWRVVDSTLVKPGCTGAECPKIKIRRLVFSGKDRFSKFLEEGMASLAELDTKQTAPFKTLAAFQKYFFTVAKPRWEVVLEAGVRRDTPDLVVVQLDSYVYAGGAHGASTTQYINWLPKVDRLLTLETMILPKTMKQFEQALRRQHTEWLKSNSIAQENPAAYSKTWPFTMSDNVALLAEGIAVTYDPYVIAPYSFGRPTLVIPYGELKGILRPELMPG